MGEDDRWNAFRSHKRIAADNPALTPWMITSLQAIKLLIFVASSLFVTCGAVVSKMVIVVVATNLHPRKNENVLSCEGNGVRNSRTVAAMYLCLALLQVIPDMFSIAQALIKISRGMKAGRVLVTVVILEGLRTSGLSLLVFCVFPQLDLSRCVALTACLSTIAVLQQLLAHFARSTRPADSFCTRMVRSLMTLPHLVLVLVMLSATYLWTAMDVPFKSNWALPAGILAASIGFWESWIRPNHEGTLFHTLHQVKYGVRKLTPSTRVAQSVVRVLCVLSVMTVAASVSGAKSKAFWRALTSYSMDYPETRLLALSVVLCVLHISLRGCARFLAAMEMRVPALVHPMTSAPLILYVLISLVCDNSACSLIKPFASLSLRWSCDKWVSGPKPFDDFFICLVWLLVGTYRAKVYTRQPTFDSTDDIIDALSPSTSGLCVEQSLVVFQHSLSKSEPCMDADDDLGNVSDEMLVRNDEVDRTLTVYICATMWHETTIEMTQMLRSMLKLDTEHIRRQNDKKSDQLQFKLEAHIYFDDAWCDDVEMGITRRIPNEFFETFFKLLNEMTGETVEEGGRMATRVLVNTPYGGRVVIRLPAGTLLFVHLKDKKLIRHKKRWSQVMYMYYLLGHRIMDSAMSIEDRQQMADSTFILAIDGDSKFEPEAVLRLLALMDQKSDIGCACGRIHPIGTGVMVWYQKFEYAIAHWFQKAAEHVFGCVLCAPGCFSLFRASALMDDNIMHKYTKTAEEPRHFVQYDQGEDRWLSTLMLKQGYRIEYAAASDAETYAPEGFEEFFNQRRRWTPSSIANTVDLLADYKRASEKNDSISRAYIAYQFMVIAFSMLGPAIIFSMVVFAQVAAFGSDSVNMMLWNGIPVLLFIVVCFTTESKVQLFYAKIMSIVYAFIMLAVIIATSSQIVLETVVSPTSMFVVAMILIFFTAACLHPREFGNIIYGSVFFLMIPSTYIFLSLYALINLNVINWGTREAVAKATGKVETKSPFERWLRRIGEGPLSVLFPSLTVKSDETVEALERKMERLEREMSEIKAVETGEDPLDRLRRMTGESLDDSNVGSDIREVVRDVAENKAPNSLNKYAWMHNNYLQACERGRLKGAEEKFWNDLIQMYLKPIESSPSQQRAIATGLASLRNNIAFSIILLNCLLALAIYLIQKHKNVLSIKWLPYQGFKWTKMNEMTGQFEQTEDPLKIDPLGMGIIVFLLAILIIQSTGMLIHRLNTLIGAFQEVRHSHDLAFSKSNSKEKDERILSAARQMMDTSCILASHAADGYTRHSSDLVGDANVLYKLQRARLAERMKRSALS